MAVKRAAKRFIRIDMAVDRLVADRNIGRDLFMAPLALQITLEQKPVRRMNLTGIAPANGSLFCQKACLFGSIAPQRRIAGDIATDGGLMRPRFMMKIEDRCIVANPNQLCCSSHGNSSCKLFQ
ncbi:MAG: hypothetical protein EB015_15175 [Methylocystaceae bacterium]|nr:hypothetical protein [Methylocystaceae bacterium]